MCFESGKMHKHVMFLMFCQIIFRQICIFFNIFVLEFVHENEGEKHGLIVNCQLVHS